MKKEEIRSSELRRLIAAICGKIRFEEVTEEEIRNIEAITLSGKFLNASTGVDLSYLELFPNLTSLMVSDIAIDQSGIDRIFALERLKSLEIVRSDFSEVTFPKSIDPNFSLRVVGCLQLPFDYPALKTISISGSNVDFARINLEVLENLHIVDSKITNIHNLENMSNIKYVVLDGSELRDKDGNIVKNINCHESTSYSHADVFRVYDSLDEK